MDINKTYIIQDNIPTDLQLMSILAKSLNDYINGMSEAELSAAISWFYSYACAQIAKKTDLTQQKFGSIKK